MISFIADTRAQAKPEESQFSMLKKKKITNQGSWQDSSIVQTRRQLL